MTQQPAPTRRDLLTAFGGETPADLPSWPWLTVTDRCTLCAACVNACPSGALERFSEGGIAGLTFTPGVCTSCRGCMSSCVRGAVHLAEQQMPVPFQPRDLIAFRTRPCPTCQAPTVAGGQCEWCAGHGVVDGRTTLIESMRTSLEASRRQR